MTPLRTSIARSALLLVFAAPLGAGVIVVDPQGGAGVGLLTAALQGAADGDVVLLRPGTYFDPSALAYNVQSKGLTIEPAPGSGRPVTNSFLISSQAPGASVVLRGLQIGKPGESTYTMGPAVSVEFTAAAVWVEDCVLYGYPGWTNFVSGPQALPAGAAALLFTDLGARVTFVRCTLLGGAGEDELPDSPLKASNGAPGLQLNGARAALHDCVVTGGRAGNGLTPIGLAADAGDGCLVKAFGPASATLLIAGCTVTGGADGDAPVGGRSGSGLSCADPVASLRTRESSLAGGALVGPGTPGVPVDVVPGTLLAFAAHEKSLQLPAALVAGQAGVLHAEGDPGDAVLLLVSTGAGFVDLPAKQGVLSLDTSPLFGPLVLGSIGAGGVLDVPFVMPALPAGLGHATLVMQSALAAGGATTLGGGSALLGLAAVP